VTGLLVLAAMAVVIGSIMQSATGFGFALVAAPVLFPVLGPKEAIGTLLVLACVGSALILAAERRRPEPLWTDATVIIATSLPGAVGGIAVLRSVDSVTLQYAVTGSVFVALLVRRYAPRREVVGGSAWWSAPAAGLAAGALTTSTNTSGPPLLLYLTGPGSVAGTRHDQRLLSRSERGECGRALGDAHLGRGTRPHRARRARAARHRWAPGGTPDLRTPRRRRRL
jgi:uncharacterized protein